MKKATVTFCAALFAATSLHAAVIKQVIVRQQWPWSTDVKVEYKLAGVTSPVDISVKAFTGETELPLPASAITGNRYGISESGIGQFVIDPVKAFGNEKIAIADFRVELELSDSTHDYDEVLYKIFCLTNGMVTPVTRRDLMNGDYGAVETDFGRIGSGFNTTLDDVVIWTGVTNDEKYATTHLVMRKVPASGKTWKIGSPVDEVGREKSDSRKETQHDVTLTEDYYIGVFEITQKQYELIMGSNPSEFSGYADSPRRPVNQVRHATMRGYRSATSGGTPNEYVNWPTNSYKHLVRYDSYIGKLRSKFFGNGITVHFDLPTEAQWEFACRAGTTNAVYSGESYSTEQELNSISVALAWNQLNASSQTHPVGLKKPNAYGLYDMYGNVMEQCLDWSVDDINVYGAADPLVDPDGGTTPSSNYARQVRGSCYNYSGANCRSAYRVTGAFWGDESRSAYFGLRVVCPVTSTGRWGD